MESLFYKAAGLTACSVIKRRLQNRCFPVIIETSIVCFWICDNQSKRSQIRGNRHTRDVQKQLKNKFSIINTRLASYISTKMEYCNTFSWDFKWVLQNTRFCSRSFWLHLQHRHQANIYLFKISNRNNKKRLQYVQV